MAVLKTKIVFSILFCLFLFPVIILNNADYVLASSPNTWIQTYGEKNQDQFQVASLIQCNDGGYAITGDTNASGIGGHQFWLLKTDSSGNMLWNQTYGSAGSNHGKGVVQTKDGGYAIVGTTNAHAAFIKIDSVGNMQWNRTFGAGSSASCVIQTSDGGYVIAGPTDTIGIDAFWLVKIDASGGTLWTKTYTQAGSGLANTVIQTNDGGYAMIGRTENENFLLVKTNLQGDLEWSKTYGTQDKGTGFSIVQDIDGSYVMEGLLWNRSIGAAAGIVKADSAGNLLWMKNYPGSGSPSSMVGSGDGGYIVCAGSMLDKVDSEGILLWSKDLSFTSGHTNITSASLAVHANDGGYAVAGIASQVGPDGQDWISYAWIEKTDSQGNHPMFLPTPSESPTSNPENIFASPLNQLLELIVVALVVVVAVAAAVLLVRRRTRRKETGFKKEFSGVKYGFQNVEEVLTHIKKA